MQARLELLLVLVALEVDEGGEEQDHVAALVHDGRVAVIASDLAGELVFNGFLIYKSATCDPSVTSIHNTITYVGWVVPAACQWEWEIRGEDRGVFSMTNHSRL